MFSIVCAECGKRVERHHPEQKYCSRQCSYETRKRVRQAAIDALPTVREVTEGKKLCRKCGLVKPLNQFRAYRPNGNSEPRHQCRSCYDEYMRLWNQRKPRTLEQRLAQVRQNMNPAWIVCRPCKICGLGKPVSEFPKGSPIYTCKPCMNKKNAAYRKVHPQRTKESVRRSKRLGRYGLTDEERNDMLRKQEGKCVICQQKFISTRETHIDHCHRTGRVRGILCRGCNNGIGHFQDNPDLLIAASIYLRMTS